MKHEQQNIWFSYLFYTEYIVYVKDRIDTELRF